MAMHYQPGTYICEVLEQALVKASTGKPMFVFKVRVQSKVTMNHESGEELIEPQMETYERTVRIVVNPNNPDSLEYAMKKLRHAGFTGTQFEQLNLTGARVRCKCEEGEYKGQPSENWDFELPGRSSSEPLENDPALNKTLNALFDRQLREPQAEKPAETPKQTHVVQPKSEGGDDDFF
jgi:hypothetical protein